MIDLPESTEFNKRVPKQKFYEHLTITPHLKRCFIDQIKSICWRNKIAPATMNIGVGKDVTEIEVFELNLHGADLDENVLLQIDRQVPYHILFLLECNGRYKACIGYKEASHSGGQAFKVNRYYCTDWLDETALPVKIEGLDTDAVYENLVRQIAGNRLEAKANETLKSAIEQEGQREKLMKQIKTLEAKIRKEKQLNKQVRLNAELKRLKKELGRIFNENKEG